MCFLVVVGVADLARPRLKCLVFPRQWPKCERGGATCESSEKAFLTTKKTSRLLCAKPRHAPQRFGKRARSSIFFPGLPRGCALPLCANPKREAEKK